MSKLTILLSRSPSPLSIRRLGSSLFLLAGVCELDTITCTLSDTHPIPRKRRLTFLPPTPSTTLPVLESTTLAWNQPPRALSRVLPRPPHIVMAMTQQIFSCHPQPLPPSNPGLLPKTFPRIVASAEQKGMRIVDVNAIMKALCRFASQPKSLRVISKY